jgi:hypothetical protein
MSQDSSSSLLKGRILEASVFSLEKEMDRPRVPVALFAENDFGVTLDLFPFLLIVEIPSLTVNEHDHIGVLFDRTGLPEIGELWSMIGPSVHESVELREGQDGELDFLGHCLEPA